MPSDATFDMQGSSIFVSDSGQYNCVLAFLNSVVANNLLQIFNTTLSFQIRDVRNLPYDDKAITQRKNEIEPLCDRAIEASKADWDSFETSWDFKKHPLV